MNHYRLSNEAKSDLLRIHAFGTVVFGPIQADKYLNNFFDCFELIAKQPMAFQSVDHIKKDTNDVYVVSIVFSTESKMML